MKKGWFIMAAVLLVPAFIWLFLLLLPTGDGSGKAAKIDTMFYEAVQNFEAQEGAEIHWTLTHVSKDGEQVQNDAVLWMYGQNWLQETVLPGENAPAQVTQLQYGDRLYTEHIDGTVYCQTTVLPGVGQVEYSGFDTWEQTETGGWVIYWERKPTGAQKEQGIYHIKGSMELDQQGNLLRVLFQLYYDQQPGHMEREFRIIHSDAAVCKEKIEAAYLRLKEKAET